MRQIKRLFFISLLSTTVFLFGFSTASAGTDATAEGSLRFDENFGLVFDKNTDSFIKKQVDLDNSNETSLSNGKFSSNNGTITLEGTLEYKKDRLELALHGNIYPAPNSGDVIYGDLKGTEEFKVVHFQIIQSPNESTSLLNSSLKTEALMIMVLEDSKSGDLIYHEIPISLKDYTHFKKESELNVKDLSESKYEKILSDISIMNRNRDHYSSDYDKELYLQKEEEILLSQDANTIHTNKDNTINNDPKLSSWTNVSINRNELERMTRDLKREYSKNRNKWIKRSNYNIPRSFFERTGHKKDDRNHTDRLYAHTINNVWLTWTAITRVEEVYHSDTKNLTFGYQHAIAGHNIPDREPVIVEYDPEEDLIRLRYQNRGVRIKDNHMFFKLSPGKSIFYEVTPNGYFAEYNNNFTLKNILGVVNYTSTIIDIWELLAGSGYYNNKPIGVPRKYPNTFNEQVRYYKNNRVIKVASADFKGTTMYQKDHRHLIDVKLSIEEDTTLSRGWSASFIGHF